MLKHLPTGIIVKVDGRSQAQNEKNAFQELQKKLYIIEQQNSVNNIVNSRNKQMVKGGRADKRRTYRVKDDIVIDHVTNKKVKLKFISKGQIFLLH